MIEYPVLMHRELVELTHPQTQPQRVNLNLAKEEKEQYLIHLQNEDDDSDMELAKLSSKADLPYDPLASQSGSAPSPTPLEEDEILQPIGVLHQPIDTSASGKRRRKAALAAESSTVPETSMSDRFCNQVDQTIHLQRELNEVLRGERGNERLSWARWLGYSSCRIHPDLYDPFIRSATHLLNEYV